MPLANEIGSDRPPESNGTGSIFRRLKLFASEIPCRIAFCGVLFFAPLARAGDYAILEQRSEPQGLFSNQSAYFLTNTVQQTVNAAPSASGYGFAYWTLNGEAVRDILGQSPPQATFQLTNDTVAIAWYLSPSLDTDADGCADYLEWRHYGSLTNGPSDDIDGDGFAHEQELARGYNPAVPDVLVDGGLMLRLSETCTLRDEAVKKRYEIRSEPQGVVALQTGYATTNMVVTTPSVAYGATSGYYFGYWEVNGVRQAGSTGLALSQVALTMTNDVVAVARFFTSADSDADGLVDWREWYWFGNLDADGGSDPDGDGFTITEELARGYEPHVRDVLVDGGLMLRLSETCTLRDEAVKKRYEIRSEPQGIVALQAGYATTNTVVTTPSVAYGATSGYYFGYWEVNGVRQAGSTGLALSQVALTMTNDVVAVARFFTSADSDADGLADWREWYWFGNLDAHGGSDPDGDGFTITEELARGYEPHVRDVLVDGGLMLRLSASFTLRDEAVKKRYEIRSEPQGIVALQTGHATTNTVVTTPSVAYGATSGYYFGYWEVNGVRQAGSTGLALSQVAMTMTNDVVAIARFFTSADSDADGLADWREWYWFGDLGMDGSSDPDGDGFTIMEELARGYEPHVRDVLVDGGLMMRLSELAVVDLSGIAIARAGTNMTCYVEDTVMLDGSSSLNATQYLWRVIAAPVGSVATVIDAESVAPLFVPDLVGVYEIGLSVMGIRGGGLPDSMHVTAVDYPRSTLMVVSAHGEPSPFVGVHSNRQGSIVSACVQQTVCVGGSRHTCTGWTGTGSVPPTGGTTNVSFVITNDSSIVWNWATEYWVEAETGTGGGGSVTGGGAWVAPGGYVVLTATPEAGYRFWRWTDGAGSVLGFDGVYTNWVVGAGSVTGWFLALPVAVIDAVAPGEPVEGAEIALSGHGSGAYAVTGYSWSVERLVEGVPDGQARVFCNSAAAVTQLAAGAWRISFQVCDAMESWSAPVTRDVTVASAAGLSDLQVSREDVRFLRGERIEIIGGIETGSVVTVTVAVHNTGSAETPGPVRVTLYEGFGPTNLASQAPGALVAVATGTVVHVAAGGVQTVALPWTVAGPDGPRTLTVVAEYAANYETAVSNGVNSLSEPLPVTERTLANNLASAMVAVGDLALPPNLLNVTVQAGTMYAGRTGTVGGRAVYGWGQAYPALGALVEVEVEGVSYVTTTRSPDGSFAVSLTAPGVGTHTATARVYDGFAVGSASCAFSCVPYPSGGGGGRYWPPSAPATAPNLVVEAVSVGGSGAYEAESGVPHVRRGGDVVVQALVRNASGFACGGGFAVAFGAGGAPLGTATVAGGLGANEARWVAAPALWVPTAVGTVTVTAEADSGGAVAELSEYDNAWSQAVAVREPRPDLRPYRIVWNGNRWSRSSGLSWSPADPVVGDELAVVATVYNCGTLPSGRPFDVALLCDGVEVGRSTVAESMEVGASTEVAFPWSTASVPPGTRTLSLVVDAAGEVDEDYESNNATARSLRLYPDAAAPVPYDLTVSPYPTVGDPCALTVRIRNDGGAAYPGGAAAFYTESPVHAPIGEGAAGAIAMKGGEGAASVAWTPGATGPVRVYVAVEGRVYSEVFNVGEIPPDLRVLSEDIALDPGSPGVGDDVRARASVRNASASVAATNVYVAFDVAVGEGIYAPLGAPRWIGALAPGESASVDASAVWSNIGRGVYVVRVTLGSAGQGDADGGDNAATRSFGVELPVADAGPDRACVLGETVTLDSGGSSNASNWLWRVTSAPSGSVAGLAGADTATPAFTPDVGGNYRIALTVGAGGAASVPDEVAVCVTGVVITASAGAHGAVAPSGAVVVATGSRPAFALTPAPGYRVAEVWVDGASVAATERYTFAPVILNHTLEARFAVASNTLTVVSAHGTADPAAGTHTFAWGSSVASRVSGVATIGATQYVCVGWAGTGSIAPHGATTNVTVALTNDSVLVWQWATNYWLDVVTSGSGTVAGATGFLPAGGESELLATEGPGFVFAGWAGDVQGCAVHAGVATARMDRARALLASFRPLPVTGLTAQVAGLNSVGLAWDYAGLAAAVFRVERSVGGGAWQTLGTVAGTAFDDSTVAEGMSLCYRVVAVVGGFESVGVEAAAAVPHLPAVPTGLGATAASFHEVALFWNAAARATGYAVQRRELPLGEWAVVAALGDVVGWTDGGVAAGGRYAYRVRGVNAAGNSAFSAEVAVTVPNEPGQWGYGLLVSNVTLTVSGEIFAPGEGVLCGAPVGGAFDALLSNPDGVFAQHRVVVGLRDTNGVPVGVAVEVGELTGVPQQPPAWATGVTVPEGLRTPVAPGTFILWAEAFLGNGDPREAFAGVVHSGETELARVLDVFEAVSPGVDEAYVRLDTVTERAGRAVDIPITVGAMGGENAFSFSLVYDPAKLRLLTIRPGKAMAASLMEVNDKTEGAVGVLMLLPLDVGLDAGLQELATVKFLIDGAVPSGVPIHVAFGDEPAFRMVVDAYGNPLPHVWHDGVVNVAAPGYEADVSPRGKWDDRVNDKDKAQIMRFVIGLDVPAVGDEFQRADCAPIDTRGDGRIDVRDVVVATRYVEGAEPLKEVGGPTGPVAAAIAGATGDGDPKNLESFGLMSGSDQRLLALGLMGLVRIDASYGVRGEVLEVPVSVLSGGNVEGVSFSVRFDPDQLVFLDAASAAVCSNALVVLNGAGAPAGVIGYALRMPPGRPLPAGSAAVLTLRFRVVRSAVDAVTLIAFAAEPTAVVLSDRNGGAISASVQAASVYLLPVVAEGAPETVGDLAAVAEEGTRVRLAWSDVAGETGYALHRRSGHEVWGLLAELPADAQGYVDSGLEPGTAYAYRIVSANAAGESWSAPVSVMVPTRYRYWADVHIGVAQGIPGGDQDGDGLSNYLEYLLGSDPVTPERGLLRTGFADIYGYGEGYFTLSFDVNDWALPSLRADTTDDLAGGIWEPAAEVGNTEVNGRRRVTYRSRLPFSAVSKQFIRLTTAE